MEDNFFKMYLEEMEGILPLTREERDEVLAGTAKGDMAARSRLVEGSLRAVLDMAKEYGGSELSMPDIVQEANTALMLAAVEYDGSEPWEELMARRVKEGIELALEEQKTERQVQETVAARVNVLQTVSKVMAEELGREASVEELAEKMKMSPEEIKDIMKLALDALSVNGEGQAVEEGENAGEGEFSGNQDAAQDAAGWEDAPPARRTNPMRDGWNLDEGL